MPTLMGLSPLSAVSAHPRRLLHADLDAFAERTEQICKMLISHSQTERAARALATRSIASTTQGQQDVTLEDLGKRALSRFTTSRNPREIASQLARSTTIDKKAHVEKSSARAAAAEARTSMLAAQLEARYKALMAEPESKRVPLYVPPPGVRDQIVQVVYVPYSSSVAQVPGSEVETSIMHMRQSAKPKLEQRNTTMPISLMRLSLASRVIVDETSRVIVDETSKAIVDEMAADVAQPAPETPKAAAARRLDEDGARAAAAAAAAEVFLVEGERQSRLLRSRPRGEDASPPRVSLDGGAPNKVGLLEIVLAQSTTKLGSAAGAASNVAPSLDMELDAPSMLAKHVPTLIRKHVPPASLPTPSMAPPPVPPPRSARVTHSAPRRAPASPHKPPTVGPVLLQPGPPSARITPHHQTSTPSPSQSQLQSSSPHRSSGAEMGASSSIALARPGSSPSRRDGRLLLRPSSSPSRFRPRPTSARLMPAAPPSGTVFSTSAPSAPTAPTSPAAVSGAVPSTDELRDELLAGAAVAATAAATYAYAAALEEEGQEAMNCVWDAGLLPPGRLPSFLAGLSSDGDSASAVPGSRPATAPGSRSAVCSRRKELALRPQRSWMRLNVDDLDEAGHDDVNRHHGDEDAAHDDERHPFSEHEQALALAALRAHPHLGALHPHVLIKLIGNGRRRILPRYACLYREGQEASHLYLVMSGQLAYRAVGKGDAIEVSEAPLPAGRACSEARALCVGAEALIRTNGALRRQQTVSALSDCLTLQLDVAELCRRLGTRLMRPVLESAFMRFVRAELGTVPVLFDNSKEEALEELAPFWELQEVGTAGEIIFGKGDEGNTLYVLISGTVTVENANKGAQPPPTLDVELVVEVNNDLKKALERFSAPDSDGENETMASLDVESFSRAGLGRPFFGEEAVLDGKPRASTVTACTPCLLLVLHRPHFGQLRKAAIDFGGRLERYRELRAQLLKTALSDMEERLQKAREEVAAKQATGREVAVGAPAAEASGAAQGRRSRRSSREVAVGAPDAAPLGAPAWQPLGIPGVPWKPTD